MRQSPPPSPISNGIYETPLLLIAVPLEGSSYRCHEPAFLASSSSASGLSPKAPLWHIWIWPSMRTVIRAQNDLLWFLCYFFLCVKCEYGNVSRIATDRFHIKTNAVFVLVWLYISGEFVGFVCIVWGFVSLLMEIIVIMKAPLVQRTRAVWRVTDHFCTELHIE